MMVEAELYLGKVELVVVKVVAVVIEMEVVVVVPKVALLPWPLHPLLLSAPLRFLHFVLFSLLPQAPWVVTLLVCCSLVAVELLWI